VTETKVEAEVEAESKTEVEPTVTPTEDERELARRVLAAPLDERAAGIGGATTVRGYLVALLWTLWDENEGFSPKRPFGDSNWELDLHGSLWAAGLVRGETDEDGDLADVDEDEADRLVRLAIRELGEPT